MRVFVYAANEGGFHGAGSAKAAYKKHGARWGVFGFAGQSYGIPTKDAKLRVLPISAISVHVDAFLDFARKHPMNQFDVVKIGCGLAGYSEKQMAPLFSEAPANCNLPPGWR
jgi:hypothetical protein